MLTNQLPKNVKIAVAVSGGADSVALLDKLVAASKEYGLSLSVVHCEHGIRGEDSLADAAFVESLAKAYGLGFQLFQADCPAISRETKESLETAARNFRYRCFEEVLNAGADYVALAHHKDDAAETALFRLSRGTSIGKVQGMYAVSGKYLRPLLDETKTEILEYVKANELSYREDKTNFERCATRNRIRLDVLPALEEAVPGAKEHLLAFAQLAKEDDEYLYSLSEELIETPCSPDGGAYAVRIAPDPILRRACLTVLKRLGLEKDYTQKHLLAVCELGRLQTGSKAVLPRGIVAVRSYDLIRFFVSGKNETADVFPPLEISFDFGQYRWGRYALTVSSDRTEDEKTLAVDRDKIPAGAVIRSRREGDVFRKFGGGEKSLKKYLIDCKIPAAIRDALPILAYKNQVLAIFGIEIADSVKLTEETKTTAYLAAKEIL